MKNIDMNGNPPHKICRIVYYGAGPVHPAEKRIKIHHCRNAICRLSPISQIRKKMASIVVISF